MIRVLVVDDSALMRKMIKEMIEEDKEITVVDSARNGKDAVIKARELRPDVITMDVNMPEMDGIAALQYIVEEDLGKVIMLSSLTQEGAMITFEALELGAFDFVPKPGGTISLNVKQVKNDLIEKIKLAYHSKKIGKENFNRKPQLKREGTGTKINLDNSTFHKISKAIAIGISTGGPKTIMDVLPLLPSDINASIFLVQHMPPSFTKQYAERLNNSCNITVVEAEAGMTVERGVCYVGKGGYHLTLYKVDKDIKIRLVQKPSHQFMPSVDVMMESVLSVYKENTIGVLMTGMGNDGASAMAKIKENGGITIAESEDTAVVFGMPREAIERGVVDYVLPSYEIANKLMELV